jgi:hypothetical protein
MNFVEFHSSLAPSLLLLHLKPSRILTSPPQKGRSVVKNWYLTKIICITIPTTAAGKNLRYSVYLREHMKKKIYPCNRP